MKMSQENSMCSYLKQKNVIFFSFTKLESRRAEQVLSGDLVPVEGERRWGESVER
jgi:hypothetical protein